jgi:hypothetical protein
MRGFPPWKMTDVEREAERACRMVRSWRDTQASIAEIERELAAMSAQQLGTLDDVFSGMMADDAAVLEDLVDYRLRRSHSAGNA